MNTVLLQGLAREVREKTLMLLGAATEAELRWAPGGLSNHVLWHAGHAVWLQDVLCIEPATGSSELPRGWTQTFGQHGRSPAETIEWPSRSEVERLLRAQLVRLQEVLGGLSADALQAPPRGQPGGPPMWQRIVHGLYDEANHQGEMYLLIKMQRAGGNAKCSM